MGQHVLSMADFNEYCSLSMDNYPQMTPNVFGPVASTMFNPSWDSDILPAITNQKCYWLNSVITCIDIYVRILYDIIN